MFFRPTLVLLLGVLVLAAWACLLPGTAEAQPCHPHMHAASEPSLAPPREAEAPESGTAARVFAHAHAIHSPVALDEVPTIAGETQVHPGPVVSMADRSCCGAGCKNAQCVGGKSATVVSLAERSFPVGAPGLFAAEPVPLFGRMPKGLRKPPRSLV
jgi:hypothetical protein